MKTLFTIIFICFLNACGSSDMRDVYVEIETDLGRVVLLLYDDTPMHRDNFIRLVRENFYDGLLFHRVIDGFMIQGGDPDSRTARQGQPLGNGGPGYTIPAEFSPQYFHKKGALAAARMGDNVNPEQASSGSQFYIVQGKLLTDEELDRTEERINAMRQQNLYFKNLKAETELNSSVTEPPDNTTIQQNAMLKTQEMIAGLQFYKIPEHQRAVYKSTGGTPHLDGSYTVFGEVVEGFDVLDKIAAVPTDERARPLQDIRMKMKITRKAG